MRSYEFAIKKDTLNSGKVIYTPVCREKRRKLFGIYFVWVPYPWQRITKIYNEYTLLDLSFTPELTYKECEEHIQAYQEKLKKSVEHHVAQEEFHILEEKDY